MRNAIIAALSGAALFATPMFAFAASDYFLKINGVEGESTHEQHKGEIEISSWSWGMSNSSSMSTGSGGGAGKVNVQDLSFTKQYDKSSPHLMKRCASGEHIKDAVITMRRTSGDRAEQYLTYKLEGVRCTSYQVSAGGDQPTESISLNFTKMTVEYKSSSTGEKAVRAVLDFVKGLFS